jgi:hypothetical protein
MWALASQVDNPIPPYPLFYTNANCAGGQTGANFPAYFLPSNCQDSVAIPTSQDNCLRVISAEDYDDGNHVLLPEQVNYLPGSDAPHSNIFPDSFNRLFSWYVPPNMRMVFFAKNPSKFLPKNIVQITFGPNYLQSDSCHANLRLSDSSTPFFAPFPPNECTDPLGFDFAHTTPWFIVIQDESYQSMIFDMCTSNRDILLGTNSLREVWHPRSNGCDLFMSSLCAVSSDPALTETCSCFAQQRALDAKYPGLNVGACCFGVDPSGDITKACAFNPNAYKTQALQDNCCSFAECQSIVSHLTPETNIHCNGNLVDFPVVIPSASATPVVITTTTTDIPSYVWVLVGLGVGIVVLCLLVAAWAVPVAPKPVGDAKI